MLPRADGVELVTHGHLEVEGRLLEASNATLLCTIEADGRSAHAVYKPVAGERPLWDFPNGTLADREVATALVAEAGGLGAVPPTVLRDGPFGPGMVQLWLDTSEADLVDIVRPHEVTDDWRVVLSAYDTDGDEVVLVHADRTDVAELAVLDIVVNNTDRKGGHVLHAEDGTAYGVDHGICLHTDPKLRTVLWGWAGDPLPEDLVEKLRKVRALVDGQLGEQLAEHVTSAEITALAGRVDGLLATATFPTPADSFRAVPWPLL